MAFFHILPSIICDFEGSSPSFHLVLANDLTIMDQIEIRIRVSVSFSVRHEGFIQYLAEQRNYRIEMSIIVH